MAKSRRKPTTVAKVSKETGVEAQDLARLPVEALDKLDALVPDAGGDDDLLGSDSPKEDPTQVPSTPTPEEKPVPTVGTQLPESDPEVVETSDDSAPLDETSDEDEGQGDGVLGEEAPRQRVLVGYHPVTEEPVYQ